MTDNSTTLCLFSSQNHSSFDDITSICLESTPLSSLLVQSCTPQPHHMKYLTENFHEPIIFSDLNDWNILKWTLKDWETKLGDEKLTFRKNNFIKSKVSNLH